MVFPPRVQDALRPLGLIHARPGAADQMGAVPGRPEAIKREKSGNASAHHYGFGIKPNPHTFILGLW